MDGLDVRLKGWTDFIHIPWSSVYSISDRCSVNLNTPAKKLEALHMSPKTQNNFLKTASTNLINIF
jgi:hypothetical protein